eukprot:420856-Pelagomonas_calceolata.AAC.1
MPAADGLLQRCCRRGAHPGRGGCLQGAAGGGVGSVGTVGTGVRRQPRAAACAQHPQGRAGGAFGLGCCPADKQLRVRYQRGARWGLWEVERGCPELLLAQRGLAGGCRCGTARQLGSCLGGTGPAVDEVVHEAMLKCLSICHALGMAKVHV